MENSCPHHAQIATLSSAISILEPVVSFVQQKTRLSRHFVTYLIGSIVWLIGVGVLLAFNDWSDVRLLGQRNIFDSLDYVTTSILLPLGGFGVSIFTGLSDLIPVKSFLISVPFLNLTCLAMSCSCDGKRACLATTTIIINPA
jgi:hypothetical protein